LRTFPGTAAFQHWDVRGGLPGQVKNGGMASWWLGLLFQNHPINNIFKFEDCWRFVQNSDRWRSLEIPVRISDRTDRGAVSLAMAAPI
jgi:hypothetical protein